MTSPRHVRGLPLHTLLDTGIPTGIGTLLMTYEELQWVIAHLRELNVYLNLRVPPGRPVNFPKPQKIQKMEPPYCPQVPQCGNGVYLGEFHSLDPVGGLGCGSL